MKKLFLCAISLIAVGIFIVLILIYKQLISINSYVGNMGVDTAKMSVDTHDIFLNSVAR